MAEIWRTHDRFGWEVVLTEARRVHILSEHDEFAELMLEVRATVERPDMVLHDRQYAHRENHYRRTPPTHQWMKVVVNYSPVPPQGTWEGTIITA